MVQREEVIQIGHQDIKITRPAKVLFPEEGITKYELIDYYRRIAPWMLPHLRGRPLAMQRYPDGINEPGFFQKNAGRYYPEWIAKVTIKKAEGTIRHVVCDDAATLVYLANDACITPHIWLSRVDKLTYPDQMVFDLDPSGKDFALVKAAAESLKRLLDELDLPAYVKTTGSRGLHVAVPLKRQEDFDSVRAFARELAKIIVAEDPAHWTLEQSKSARRGRVFLDTNRNAYAQTIAPVYAVRARRGAPVAAPLEWAELRSKNLRPDGVTIRTIFDRHKKIGDPWKDLRKFEETPEPSGRSRRLSRTRIFVVQKHDASRLHYDFRLEIKGVLTSWAVPKGPSLNPADKRLATMTEDHPLEYADFEGVIPEGHYGAGTVMVWDKGVYEVSDSLSAERQLARGEIKIVLHGKKLRGGFVLIHIGKRSANPAQKKLWLLIKHRDKYANPKSNAGSAELDWSVLTGRTLKEIERDRPAKKLKRK